MNHAHLFAFEADFVATLRCIPMAVRLKLDLSEIKLSLRQWSRLTTADRRTLLETPCESQDEVAGFRAMLIDLVHLRSGEIAKILTEPPEPLWKNGAQTPQAVIEHAHTISVLPPSADAWRRLNELQRFALLKLSRDNHDNVNFLPAMQEFGLLTTSAAA
jgi:hypothetical protein